LDPSQHGEQGPALWPDQRPRLGGQPVGGTGVGVEGREAAAQLVGRHLEPLEGGHGHGQRRGGGVDGRHQPGHPPGHAGVGQGPVVERVAVDQLEHGHPQPGQPAPGLPGPGRPGPRDGQALVGQGVSQHQGRLGRVRVDGRWPLAGSA
jgi:hypothetical protein